MGSLSERYSKAIYEYLGDPKTTEAVSNELQEFGSVLASNQELKVVCNTAVFSSERRLEVVNDVALKMELSDHSQRILKVLAENGRLALLKKVSRGLKERMLEAANTVPLQVDAPVELDAGDKEAIEQKFKKTLGKEVDANFHVDPKLLGGIRVTVAGRTYDATLANQIGALKEMMAGG